MDANPVRRDVLAFANGEIEDGEMVRRAIDGAVNPLIVAADGGARIARYYGLKPHAVIGDMDSLGEVDLAAFRIDGAAIHRYPEAKNETDLELALLWAVEQGAGNIRMIGATGGRLDQAISNVYLMALPALQDADVRIVAGKQETWLATPGETLIDGAVGDTVSLIPLSGIARGVRTENLYYPLRDEDLLFGPARGVSNIMSGERASVHLREGVLLVVHTIGRA
jgi:thiamine pyrophosphokinase